MAIRLAFKRGAQAAGTVGAVGAGAIVYKAQQDEGFHRSVTFWRRAFPIYVVYRSKQFYMESMGIPEEEQDAEYEKLHNEYAPKMFDIVLELKGFYVKLAQIGSTRGDFLPKQFLDLATTLQDEAPSKPLSDIQDIISASLGRPWDQVFREIDEKPLGTASIGQAHRAVLRETGEQVAVKVQHPNAETFFRWDIETVKDFCRYFQPVHLRLLEEVEKQFMTEFDYEAEADNLVTIRANLLESPFADKVVVPYPHKDLCTREVLVMEYLAGQKLVDAIQNHYIAIAAEKGMTLDELRKQQAQEDEERFAKGLDIDSGPDETHLQVYNAYVKSKRVVTKAMEGMYDWTLGWMYPVEWTPVDSHELLNVPRLLELMMDVHGYEMLVDGSFNGDPHPGNVMLLDDGKLGLIDYGQVKHISKETRHALAKLLLVLADGGQDDIVRVMLEDIGIRSTHTNAYFLEKQARMMMDKDDRTITEGMNIQAFVEYLDTIDRVEYIPEEFVMPMRMSLLLRGFSYALHYRSSHAQSWKKLAQQVLEEDL